LLSRALAELSTLGRLRSGIEISGIQLQAEMVATAAKDRIIRGWVMGISSKMGLDRPNLVAPLGSAILILLYTHKKRLPVEAVFSISANTPEVKITSLRVFRIQAQQIELAGCGKRYAR
jgi:hypothetical protein